jgi:hypothetical protein
MVTLRALDVPPPGAGFTTVTLALPATLRSDEGIWAESRPLFTKVVTRLDPLHWTTEEAMKPVPVTARLNPPPPANTPEGTDEVNAGTGFP